MVLCDDECSLKKTKGQVDRRPLELFGELVIFSMIHALTLSLGSCVNVLFVLESE